jgi:hypothetical protein
MLSASDTSSQKTVWALTSCIGSRLPQSAIASQIQATDSYKQTTASPASFPKKAVCITLPVLSETAWVPSSAQKERAPRALPHPVQVERHVSSKQHLSCGSPSTTHLQNIVFTNRNHLSSHLFSQEVRVPKSFQRPSHYSHHLLKRLAVMQEPICNSVFKISSFTKNTNWVLTRFPGSQAPQERFSAQSTSAIISSKDLL